jgi:hypothetical protein
MNLYIWPQKEHLYAVANGKLDLASCAHLFKRAASLAVYRGFSKILFDARLVTGSLSVTERMILALAMADHVEKLGQKTSVAFIDHRPTFDGRAVGVGRSRGFDVEMFKSIPEGLAWLRRGRFAEKRPIAA